MGVTTEEIISSDHIKGANLRSAIDQLWLFDGKTYNKTITFYIDPNLDSSSSFIQDTINKIDALIDLDFSRVYSRSAADIYIHYQYYSGGNGQVGLTTSGAHGSTSGVWDPSIRNYVYTTNWSMDQIDVGIEPTPYGTSLSNYKTVKDSTANTILHELGHALGLDHPNGNPTDERYTNKKIQLCLTIM